MPMLSLSDVYLNNKILFFSGGYNIQSPTDEMGIDYCKKASGKLDRVIFAIQSFLSCLIPCYRVSNLKINILKDDGTSESHFYLVKTRSLNNCAEKKFSQCTIVDHLCLSGREITLEPPRPSQR